MSTIAVIGTFDTQGVEHAYVADCIRDRGDRADACVNTLLENMRRLAHTERR